jgi:hypothetical protein
VGKEEEEEEEEEGYCIDGRIGGTRAVGPRGSECGSEVRNWACSAVR